MAKFQFKDNSIKLDINDIPFVVDVNIFYKNQDVKAATEKLNQFLTGKTELSEADAVELEKQFRGIIDTVLGTGAYEKIFKDRPFNLIDAYDLITFLSEEIQKFKVEINLDKYSPTV